MFFDQSYFYASGSHYWNKGGSSFKEKAYYCCWTTDFLASRNQIRNLIFQRLLPVTVFFRLVETMFQEIPSFRLVETDFRANNGEKRKAVNKRTLLPLNKNSNSTSRNERFI